MKITIFSESPNDEAAIRILVEKILGEEIEEVPRQNQLRSRGINSLLNNCSVVIRAAYYQTDSEAVVIVCDSNDKPVHIAAHEESDNKDSLRCRFCILKRKASETLASLQSMKNRKMIKVGIGVAVPAIEAWLMVGNDDVSEEKWIRKLQGEKIRYDKVSLKSKLYGDRPFKKKQIETAVIEAKRISESLSILENKFPEGFGNLVREIRSWK